MKKLLTLVVFLSLIAYGSHAQRCTPSGIAAITPLAPTGVQGFTPPYGSLACIDSGSYVSDTIYFENYSVYSGYTVTSLIIDSIYNLPAGLCWESNLAADSIPGGQTGAIYISGTCIDHPAAYKLVTIATLNMYDPSGGGTLNIPDAALDIIGGTAADYYLRVRAPGSQVCPYTTLDATIIPGGPTTICPGSSITFSSGSIGAGYSYQWSSGQTTSSITANTAGTYSLTVTFDTTTVSSSIQLSIDTIQAFYALSQDPTTPHSWIATEQCLDGANQPLSYIWYWGDSDTSFSTTPVHSYDSAGYYDICVYVYDSYCGAVYCDSSTYVYKTDAQMISVRVVNAEATGIAAIAADGIAIYPNPASRTLTVETPAGYTGIATICDMLGRPVREVNISATKTTIDISTIPDGMYTISLPDGKRQFVVMK